MYPIKGKLRRADRLCDGAWDNAASVVDRVPSDQRADVVAILRDIERVQQSILRLCAKLDNVYI